MKKILSLILALSMLFSLSMPAMAAEVTGNTENEVTATFNPEIKITGMEYYGADATYDENTNTYIVVTPAGTTAQVGVKLVGKNLNLAESSTHLQLKRTAPIIGEITYKTDRLVKDGFIITMNTDSTVTYQYSNDSGSAWSDETLKIQVKQGYSVTVNESENGTVTADKSLAASGDTVSLTVSPEEGYMLDTLTVTDANGASVTVNNNQFTMSARAVTVNATFKLAPVPHDITITSSVNGTVSADLNNATAGTTVKLTVTPADDYQLATLAVNNGAVVVTKVNDTTYTFVMPDAEATVSAAFEKIPHNITIAATEHGTVTASKETAVEGDSVTLTVTPDAMYKLGTITVTRKDTDAEVTVTDKTFVMPASDVTVTVTFEKMPISSVSITWGSMEFTYDDTVAEGATKENGWTYAEGANAITVENTGETTFTAQAAYASYEGYESITGSFDTASKELAPASGEQADEKYTFTLELSGKPTKALSGDKIGKVTITINEAAEE